MSLDERLDPVDLLASYTPPVGWNARVELTGPDADEGSVERLDRILGGRLRATGPRRRHLRLVTGVVVAVTLGGAAAAAAATFWSRSPTDAATVACWSEPVAPPEAQVAFGWDGTGDPVALCVDEWLGGDLGADGPPKPLQACVTTEGIAAVVPGNDGTCAALGLASFAPLDTARADSQRSLDVADLERLLVEKYNTGPCRAPDAIVAEVRTVLDERGFDAWKVQVTGFSSAADQCASVGFDSAANTVLIVPA